jgi:hypothetical protein
VNDVHQQVGQHHDPCEEVEEGDPPADMQGRRSPRMAEGSMATGGCAVCCLRELLGVRPALINQSMRCAFAGGASCRRPAIVLPLIHSCFPSVLALGESYRTSLFASSLTVNISKQACTKAEWLTRCVGRSGHTRQGPGSCSSDEGQGGRQRGATCGCGGQGKPKARCQRQADTHPGVLPPPSVSALMLAEQSCKQTGAECELAVSRQVDTRKWPDRGTSASRSA